MPAPSFEQFCSDFRQFRAMVGKVLETAKDGPLKQKLAEATRAMDERFSTAQTVYPQAMADLQGRKEAVIQKLQQQQTKIAALKEQTAATAAKPKVPKGPAVPPKPAAIDPTLGAKLREELLARFGRPQAEDANPAIREVWEDWDWEHWEKN